MHCVLIRGGEEWQIDEPNYVPGGKNFSEGLGYPYGGSSDYYGANGTYDYYVGGDYKDVEYDHINSGSFEKSSGEDDSEHQLKM